MSVSIFVSWRDRTHVSWQVCSDLRHETSEVQLEERLLAHKKYKQRERRYNNEKQPGF